MGTEDTADRKRGGKTTSGNGKAWSSPCPRGQWKREKMEKIDCEVIYGAPKTPAVNDDSRTCGGLFGNCLNKTYLTGFFFFF